MALPQAGDQPWADTLNGYLTDLKNEADATQANMAGHESASDPHGVLPKAATDAAAKVSAHTAASDPHGDRTNTVTQISTHAAANDPHGDRGFTITQVNTHANAQDPHGDRAYAASVLALPGAVYASLAATSDVNASGTPWGDPTKVLSATVIVPSSGNLKISFGFTGYNKNTSASFIRLTPVLSGANVKAADSSICCYSAADGDKSPARIVLLTGLNPGTTTVKLQGNLSSGDASTSSLFNQWMYLEPVH